MLEKPNSVRNEFSNYILEQLSPLGDLTLGRFFGGQSIKYNGKQFCMVMKNRLYFRVGPASVDKFKEKHSEPFSYSTKKGQVMVKSYYEVPEEILDDADLLLSWARLAIEMASYKK